MSIKEDMHKNLKVGDLVKLTLHDDFGESFQPAGYVSKLFSDIIALSQLPRMQGSKGNRMTFYNPSKEYSMRNDAEQHIIKYQKLKPIESD